ncbi:MAG: dihydroneopterin aldolase [Candidatus Kaiserbacteria bacterium]|nr:dihydroneopterin aldolase [Candidatus Kaiserbacteria bacterium]
MDRVFLNDLRLRGKHGVNPDERVYEQEFVIDIVAHVDTKTAAASDELTDAVNYVQFSKIAQEVVEQESFYLIERLADTIAKRILEDARITTVEVTVRKPEVLNNGVPGVKVIRERR